MVPKYGRIIKTLIDKKIKYTSGVWNKENGKNVKVLDHKLFLKNLSKIIDQIITNFNIFFL